MENVDKFKPVSLQEWPSDIGLTHAGKWHDLHRDIERRLTPNWPVVKYTLPNKELCCSAQSSINGTHRDKDGVRRRAVIPPEGYHFVTRTRPVGNKDGEYYLWIGLAKNTK